MKNWTLTVFAVLLLGVMISGCSSIPKLKDFNKIESGMTRAQVEKILGEPKSTSMQDGRQILIYDAADGDETKPRWVVFQDKEVIFYGKPSEYQARQEKLGSMPGVTVSPTISPTISPIFNVNPGTASGPQSYQAPVPLAPLTPIASNPVVDKAAQYNNGEHIIFTHENKGAPAVTTEGN